MRQQLRQLSGDTAVYGITTIVQRFLSFILTPFYTWYLAPAELGVQAGIFAIIAFVMVIANAGMEAAYFRHDAEARTPDEHRVVFWNAVAVNWGVAALIALFLGLVPQVANRAMFFSLSPEYIHLIRYAGLIILLDAASTIAMASLRMERKARAFGGIKIAAIVVFVGVTIWFVAVRRMGVEGVFLAGIVQSLTLFVLTLPILARRLPLDIDRGILRHMLDFGVPTIFSSLALIALQVIDRPIMMALAGPGTTGLYQAGFRLGIPMMMFVAMFEFAWRPYFLQQADQPNARELFARIFTYFNVVSGLVFLIVAFYVVAIAAIRVPFTSHSVIARNYWSGLPIVPIVLGGYIFNGWYTNFIVGIYLMRKTRSLPWITGLGAITEAALCFALIPMIGLFGGAWATFVAYVVMAVVLYVYVQRHYPVPYEWGRVARALGGVAVLYGINALLLPYFEHSLRAGLIRLGLLVAYPLWLWASGFFNPSELRAIGAMIPRRAGGRAAQ